MKYRIFRCFDAYRLLRKAHEAGFTRVWLPTEKTQKLRRPTKHSQYFEEVTQAAVPGYIYVPRNVADAFIAWCPSMYNATQLVEYYGEGGLTEEEHNKFVRPAELSLAVLKRHEAIIREANEAGRHRLVKRQEFSKGDKVIVEVIEGMELSAEVTSVKKDGRVRVSVISSGHYLNVNPEKIRHRA